MCGVYMAGSMVEVSVIIRLVFRESVVVLVQRLV
jgi:hypothetical protein